MPRCIDAEKLEQHFEYCIAEAYNTNGVTEDFVTALRATRNQPTVDVVEVVRCKDCKYAHYWYGNDDIGNTKYLCHYIEYDTFYPDVFADDYCSRGERRE